MGRVFELAEQYLDQLSSGEFVEIGTSRNGDDGSTKTLAEWALKDNSKLITVDVDPVNCDFVHGMNLTNVEIVNSTGEQYLYKRIYSMRPIKFLYLDNFDWDWNPVTTEKLSDQSIDSIVQTNGRAIGADTNTIRTQQQRYQTLGLTMNNTNSQRAHLQQAILAVPHMAACSVIVCDDTWFNPFWGHYTGKSGAAVLHLLNNGFSILHTSDVDYGTILGRGLT